MASDGFAAHQWWIADWNSKQWRDAWPRLIEDARTIIEQAGVPLIGEPKELDDGSWQDTEPTISVEHGIYLNSRDHTYEDFRFSAKDYEELNWCKTNRGDYNLVVACILLRAHVLAPDSIIIDSDDLWDGSHWQAARSLHSRIWPEDTLAKAVREEEPAALDQPVDNPVA